MQKTPIVSNKTPVAHAGKENMHEALVETKKERLKTEEEVRALKNRINLLMNEEKKAQRKFEEAKKKTKALEDIKLETQQHIIEKEEAKLKQLKDTLEQQEKARKLREKISFSQQKARAKLQKTIKKTAEEIRNEKQALREKQSKLRESEIQKKGELVSKVKDQQREGLIHRIQFIEEKLNRSHNVYDEKIRLESEQSMKNKAEIARLSYLEGQLLAKLQSSQDQKDISKLYESKSARKLTVDERRSSSNMPGAGSGTTPKPGARSMSRPVSANISKSTNSLKTEISKESSRKNLKK